MKYLLLIISLIIAIPASADDYITVGLTSKHIKTGSCNTKVYICDYKFNDENTGLGYKTSLNDKYSIAIGFYDNSMYNTSTYVAISRDWKYGGIVANFVTGYEEAIIVPLVGPYITLPLNKKTSIDIVMPVTISHITVFAAQAKFKF